MEKKFVLDLTEEQVNYLQRIGTELDGKVFLLDRMFETHAMDTDTSMFQSVPFKHFMAEYENTYAEWELAKKHLEDSYIRPEVLKRTNGESVNFQWAINDYLAKQCEVTIL